MKCGAPSSVIVPKRFAWTPTTAAGFWWFGLLGLLISGILALIQTRRVLVPVPLCEQHKGHWSMRLLINLLGLFVVLVFGIVAVVAVANDVEFFGLDSSFFVFLAGGVFVAWIILLTVLHYTAIRTTEITEYQVILTGVSHGYVEALREEWGYEDGYGRSRRRRRRDDDDDDRPRRRRRRREDDDEEDEDRSRRRRKRSEEEEDAPRPKAKDRSEDIYDPRKPKSPRGDSEAIQGDED